MRTRPLFVALVGLTIALVPRFADADDSVRELRQQRIGNNFYVLVSLRTPDGLRMPIVPRNLPLSEGALRDLGARPRLVPQDSRGLSVYRVPDGVGPEARRGLTFVARWQGESLPETVRCLLLVPVGEEPSPPGAFEPDTRRLLPRRVWREHEITLDLRKARHVPAPSRPNRRPLAADDLEGLWAYAWSADLAALEAQSHGLSFFALAREAIARRYGVRAPGLTAPLTEDAGYHRLFYNELAPAQVVNAELQRRRLAGFSPTEERTVKASDLQGIDPVNTGWEKQLAERSPPKEPLAEVTPADNYFLRFRDFRKFLRFVELLEDWAERAAPDLELKRVINRYETQLGVNRTAAARTFGPLAVRSLGFTGNDPYLLEGSDIAVLFQPFNVNLFSLSIDVLFAPLRERYGDRLREEKSRYHDVAIQSLFTLNRDFSVHRARVGDFYVLANSLAGLHRILDVHAGRSASLAKSPDFRQLCSTDDRKLATVDGVMFVSEAFLRKLAGPQTKLKQRRRLEARVSLGLATNGALFTAWDSGQSPTDLRGVLQATRLRPDEIETSEKHGVLWDGREGRARSQIYGTLEFMTPLIELPLDRVTEREAKEYREFRADFLSQPRYADPFNACMSLDDRVVKLDVHLLPLTSAGLWPTLRKYTKGDPLKVSKEAGTLLRAEVHLSEAARRWYSSRESLGDSLRLHLPDSPGYLPLAELVVQMALRPNAGFPTDTAERLRQAPLLASVGVKDRTAFDRDLKSVAELLYLGLGPFRLEKLEPAYRGVTFTRVRFSADSGMARQLGLKSVPILYHAHIGDRWYLSSSDQTLRTVVDAAPADAKNAREVQAVLNLAPREAVQARTALRLLLEWESHRRALPGCAAWFPLYRAGLLSDDASDAVRREAALRYLGFIPISPDGAQYAFDAVRDEVVNRRHGSLRRPELHPGIDEVSPLGTLLQYFASIQMEVTFPGDEIRLGVTIDRASLDR